MERTSKLPEGEISFQIFPSHIFLLSNILKIQSFKERLRSKAFQVPQNSSGPFQASVTGCNSCSTTLTYERGQLHLLFLNTQLCNTHLAC